MKVVFLPPSLGPTDLKAYKWQCMRHTKFSEYPQLTRDSMDTLCRLVNLLSACLFQQHHVQCLALSSASSTLGTLTAFMRCWFSAVHAGTQNRAFGSAAEACHNRAKFEWNTVANEAGMSRRQIDLGFTKIGQQGGRLRWINRPVSPRDHNGAKNVGKGRGRRPAVFPRTLVVLPTH